MKADRNGKRWCQGPKHKGSRWVIVAQRGWGIHDYFRPSCPDCSDPNSPEVAAWNEAYEKWLLEGEQA